MSSVTVLAEPLMTYREAARQLRIPPTTLDYWLEGGERKGVFYSPVLRQEPTGSGDVTWGEMVEARYLRAYRNKRVSLQQLRAFIVQMREEFQTPFPLATFKPFIGGGRRLLLKVQEKVGLPNEYAAIYELASRQLVFAKNTEDFLSRVEFADDEPQGAVLMFPAGRESPVVINPRLASGAATVRGIRTERLAEVAHFGTPGDVAEEFSLTADEVRAALSYEWARAA